MDIVTDRQALQKWVDGVRRRGETVGFVPTMGALHEGHLSLIRAAKQQSDRVIASIFVNPTQFGLGEDFDRYPRTLNQDQALLAQAGCSAVFHPAVAEIYPPGSQTTVRVEPLGSVLCGQFRPAHFQGVATVVAILLNLVRPNKAFFGRKDYQQIVVIRQMVQDLAIPVEVVGVPTLREADGLAMSSRNRYLTLEERCKAVGLYQALLTARQTWQDHRKEHRKEQGRPTDIDIDIDAAAHTPQETPWVRSAVRVLDSFGIQDIDYVEVRDAQTLNPLSWRQMHASSPTPIMLIAARIGTTRLIDNMVFSLGAAGTRNVPHDALTERATP